MTVPQLGRLRVKSSQAASTYCNSGIASSPSLDGKIDMVWILCPALLPLDRLALSAHSGTYIQSSVLYRKYKPYNANHTTVLACGTMPEGRLLVQLG